MKKCSKCGIEKELDEFYKIKSSKDGHGGVCKKCNSQRVREKYYEKTESTRPKKSKFVPLHPIMSTIREFKGWI